MASKNARRLRKNQTDVEYFFWLQVRNRAFEGFKFRRQVPAGPYVVDFYCATARLVIELDGGQHSEREEYDLRRTEYLNSNGYRVLRFWNHEVFKEWDAVKQVIWESLTERSKSESEKGA